MLKAREARIRTALAQREQEDRELQAEREKLAAYMSRRLKL